ncbi:MAG: 16S rRNA (uracil(1498)-N(3))-methyltransferase [Dethiobacter sp.]|jgi:16S rRNA (uracil1498-N3)-methyltransferase|nr:MAG: 16S rRNA (uracil(1498)-N(3))-methyltransferase [Dethiobacter sp.]
MSCWFFLPPEEIHSKENIVLKADNLMHLKALRLAKGDLIVLADGKGRAFYARLDFLASDRAEASILYELEKNVEPPLEVTLALGVSKGEKMDLVIRHSVELGVKKIVPVLTGRTVVRVTAEKVKGKNRRWQNIALSAASQCRRSFIPEVLAPLSFTEALEIMARNDLVIVPWEEEKEQGLRHLAEITKRPQEVCIFTGPEGGISFEEMEKLKELPEVYPVTLGPRILRAETAPLAVLAIVMYLWGDLAGVNRP